MRKVVVILAGGEGQRIGGGKPLRVLGGRALIDHALGLARQWAGDVAISVRDADQVGGAQVPLLIDDDGDGPIAGIASALRYAKAEGFEAVLTIPTDTPLLPQDLVDRLSATLDSPPCPQGGVRGGYVSGKDGDLDKRTHPQPLPARREGSKVAIAVSGGRLHPTCALWRVEAVSDLPAYLATGRRSLMGFAEQVGFSTAEWPVEPYDPFFNVNSADDLAEAEALLRSR